MSQLKSIHTLFKKIEKDELISEEKNQIHPTVKEMFQKFNAILSDN